MHKSKDISKYNIDWQILRANIKGDNKDLPAKLNKVFNFFQQNPTKDNWERCVNFLEGLSLGFKAAGNQHAINLIKNEIAKYGDSKDLQKEKNNSISNVNDIAKYSFQERYKLWVDLFKRNQKWLEKGYLQKEINEFMDNLYNSFTQAEKQQIKQNYSKANLVALRSIAEVKPNTHKFFF